MSIRNSTSPGRTQKSTLDAPNHPDPAAAADACFQSRPGISAVGGKEGGFQNASSGKYNSYYELPSPGTLSNSSFQLLLPSINQSPSTSADSALKVYYQNVRGLRTKIDSWFLAVTGCDYDVIALTET